MKRVVVTGMGVVTPLGNDLGRFREALLAGRSGIGPLTLFPAEGLPTRIAGQSQVRESTHRDRKVGFALAASQAAVEMADSGGLAMHTTHDPRRSGLSIGIGLELFDMEDLVRCHCNGYVVPEPDQRRAEFLQTPSDVCVRLLAERHQLEAPPAVHVSACAASNDAVGHAFLRIRRGEATMMLAGGADSMLNPLGVGGFARLEALSTRNDAPTCASRPFDAERDGFVLGEGAGMLVLEELGHASRRGARSLAEVIGYGNSFDAHTASDPHPEGRGALLAMSRAVRMAGIAPEQISYINAHGTSTPKNDPVETLAIKRLLGPRAYQVPVSSTKSMIGHLISAAGAVGMIASILCANAGMVHPTVNLEHPDPACDLDYVPGSARPHRVDCILCNAFAFGGQNAVLALRSQRSCC